MGDKILISDSKRRIEVNDSGECIVFDVRDHDFISGFLDIIKDFETKSEDYKKKANEVSNMPGNTTAELVEKAIAANELNRSICDSLTAQINALFKDDVCKKLFGNISPNVLAFAEFFEQLTPIIKSAQKEQNYKISKYTAKYHSEK